MHRDRLLAASILALAVAVGFHGLAPAFAQEAPKMPMARLSPECRNIRVGTAKEVAGLMGDLAEKGHEHFVVVGSGLLCGWQ